MNLYKTLAPLPFGNPDEEDTDEVVTEGHGRNACLPGNALRCIAK